MVLYAIHILDNLHDLVLGEKCQSFLLGLGYSNFIGGLSSDFLNGFYCIRFL